MATNILPNGYLNDFIAGQVKAAAAGQKKFERDTNRLARAAWRQIKTIDRFKDATPEQQSVIVSQWVDDAMFFARERRELLTLRD